MKIRFFNFFLNHMVQKYQNEISPILYYGISTKTNEKDLKIPNLQPPNWKRSYWMTLYVKIEELYCSPPSDICISLQKLSYFILHKIGLCPPRNSSQKSNIHSSCLEITMSYPASFIWYLQKYLEIGKNILWLSALGSKVLRGPSL